MRPYRVVGCFCSGGADKLHLAKTCFFQQSKLIPHGDRSTYSLGPGFDAIGQQGGKLLIEYNVGKLQSAAGTQHPKDLLQQG